MLKASDDPAAEDDCVTEPISDEPGDNVVPLEGLGKGRMPVCEDAATTPELENVVEPLNWPGQGTTTAPDDVDPTIVEPACDVTGALVAESQNAVELPCATLESPDTVVEDVPVKAPENADDVALDEPSEDGNVAALEDAADDGHTLEEAG
jgi:hypothetical protein